MLKLCQKDSGNYHLVSKRQAGIDFCEKLSFQKPIFGRIFFWALVCDTRDIPTMKTELHRMRSWKDIATPICSFNQFTHGSPEQQEVAIYIAMSLAGF